MGYGLCVCKTCAVGERRASVIAKRIDLEKLARRETPEKEALESILCELW